MTTMQKVKEFQHYTGGCDLIPEAEKKALPKNEMGVRPDVFGWVFPSVSDTVDNMITNIFGAMEHNPGENGVCPFCGQTNSDHRERNETLKCMVFPTMDVLLHRHVVNPPLDFAQHYQIVVRVRFHFHYHQNCYNASTARMIEESIMALKVQRDQC